MSGIPRWCLASAVLTIMVLPALAGPASAAPYAWKLTCKGDGYSTASWEWLQDGQVITGAGGTANCDFTASVSGGGTRPANANGLTARLTASGFCWPDTCVDSKTVTRSFDPAKPFSVSLKVSFNGFDYSSCWPGEGRHCGYQVSGSATFTLSS